MERSVRVQNIVIDFFEKYDNNIVCDFILSFIYFKPVTNKDIGSLIDRFLKDNELTAIYLSYCQNMKSPSPTSMRCTLLDKQLLSEVNFALLNLSFNRLNNIIDENRNKSR